MTGVPGRSQELRRDPTGSYYRYAFTTGVNFPDHPKYGVWTDSCVITTREFGLTVEYGIGVYGLEKKQDAQRPASPGGALSPGRQRPGDPAARRRRTAAGRHRRQAEADDRGTPVPLVGPQDDGAGYGATFDAVTIWDFSVKWRSTPLSSLTLKTQLSVAAFDSIFPCGPASRDCLPQPGVTDPSRYLDILSYRQRPTWRLAYRGLKGYESLVTNQSVEAAPGVAGVRWYEIRRSTTGAYSVFQQGTYAPGDGVHRWMSSIAQNRRGNLGLGYSVVNGTDVYPGIRYTGRLFGDPAGR